MQAWETFLSLQESELGAETVQKWLRPLKVIRFDACNLYLEAKDAFQVLWFEEHVRAKAQTKLLNNNNKRIKIHLGVANAAARPAAKSKIKKTDKEASPSLPKFGLTFDNLDPHFTFDHFVSNPSNQLAYKLLTGITGFEKNSPNNQELGAFNPIYVCGPSGTGKTHLLMATAHALRNRGLNVIYSSAETFTEHVVTAIRAGEMSVFRQAYRNIDALLIDDIHIFSRKGATQEEFFHTFNTLHLSGKQIILSANCTPQELQLIEPRLVSRFEWGIVLPLDLPNNDEMAQVLQKKAEALNYKLPPKVVEFLIETFPSGTKSIMRALKALILRSHLNERTGSIYPPMISVHQAKIVLNDLILQEQQMALTPGKIIQQVAEYFGIKSEDILGKAQSRDCVLPRQIAMYFCRTELKMPFMKIGDLFEKDHSTVMSSVKLIQRAVENDERDIAGPLDIIRKKLKQ